MCLSQGSNLDILVYSSLHFPVEVGAKTDQVLKLKFVGNQTKTFPNLEINLHI